MERLKSSSSNVEGVPAHGRLVCCSIGGASATEMGKKARDAFGQGCDLVELRIDHILNPTFVEIIEEVSGILNRSVVTVRPRSQGGEFAGPEEERVGLIRELGSRTPAFVDIELDLAERDPGLLTSLSHSRRIISWHDTNATPTSPAMKDIVGRELRLGHIGKLITTPNSDEDERRVAELYEHFDHERLVAFCLGEAGTRTRVLSARVAPLVYCSLPGEQLAPGQLSISEAILLVEKRDH